MTGNGGRRYLVGAIACASVLVAGLVWLLLPETASTGPYPLVRASLPDLRNEAGPAIRIGGPRARPLVINFFFSDCVGCVTELPRIEAASKRWAGRIDVLGIDHFEPRASGLGIVRSSGITFPVAWDRTGDLAPSVRVMAFPATLFVGRDGVVRRRVLGQISEVRLNRELEALFDESRVN